MDPRLAIFDKHSDFRPGKNGKSGIPGKEGLKGSKGAPGLFGSDGSPGFQGYKVCT